MARKLTGGVIILFMITICLMIIIYNATRGGEDDDSFGTYSYTYHGCLNKSKINGLLKACKKADPHCSVSYSYKGSCKTPFTVEGATQPGGSTTIHYTIPKAKVAHVHDAVDKHATAAAIVTLEHPKAVVAILAAAAAATAAASTGSAISSCPPGTVPCATGCC